MAEREEAIDPVCNMTVDVATAKFTAERDGETYYFCCDGCRHRGRSGSLPSRLGALGFQHDALGALVDFFTHQGTGKGEANRS